MDYRNTYPYSSSTRKDNDYREYYKKKEYNDNNKYNQDKYNQDKKNDKIKDEKIISSSINKPDNDNFESSKTKSLVDINKKQELLIKYKQELEGKIDGFNEQMSSLLELKECHKQPFNLNEIRLEKIVNKHNIANSLKKENIKLGRSIEIINWINNVKAWGAQKRADHIDGSAPDGELFKKILSLPAEEQTFDLSLNNMERIIQKFGQDFGVSEDEDSLDDKEWYQIYLYVNENGNSIEEKIKEIEEKMSKIDKNELNVILKGEAEEVKTLPKVKPNSSPPQYFSCLKCNSSECKGKDRIMTIYQFNEKNEIIDESFKNYILENGYSERLERGVSVVGDVDASISNGLISHDDVQFITSNYDECYTSYKLNQPEKDEKDFIITYKKIEKEQKYKISNNKEDALWLNTNDRGTEDYNKNYNEYIKYDIKSNIEDNLRDFNLYAGEGDNDDMNNEFKKIFKCGCVNHSTNNYDNYGISIQTKSKCDDFRLIERSNHYSYKFTPIDDNNYEPKTIFFCMTCKKFFRYNCIRDINQDKNSGKVIPINDYSIIHGIKNISETLPIINKNILFRTPLFNKEYSQHLEKTARDLKLTIMNQILGNNQIKTSAKGFLGNIISTASDKNYDLSKDKLADGIKKIGSSLIESKLTQKGGINLDSITENISNINFNIGNDYGKLKLKNNFEGFLKELEKWKVHPQEDNYLIKLKSISSSIVKVDENDKKPIRGKFIITQEDYISDFENKFSTIKNYYPFLKEDFNTLESLKISGDDNNDVYTKKKINIWGKGYSIMNELNKSLNSTGISHDNKLMDDYVYLDDRLARKVRSYKNDFRYSSSLSNSKEILKLMCNLNFTKEQISALNRDGEKSLLYFKLLDGQPIFRDNEDYKFLERYGDLKYIQQRLFGSPEREQANITVIISKISDIVKLIERTDEELAVTIRVNLDKEEREYLDGGPRPPVPTSEDVVEVEINYENYEKLIEYYSAKLPYFEYTLSAEKIINQMNRNNPSENGAESNVWTGELHSSLIDFEKLMREFQMEDNVDRQRDIYRLDFSSESLGYRKFKTITETLNNNTTFKKGIEELNNVYKKKKEELDKELKSSLNFKGKSLDIDNPVYESLVSEMCGGNSGIFWYGNNSEKYKKYYNLENYQIARSIHSRCGIIYFPWYEIGFDYNKLINGKKFLKMDIKNLNGSKDNDLICSTSKGENTSEDLTLPSSPRRRSVVSIHPDAAAAPPRPRQRLGSIAALPAQPPNILETGNDNKTLILEGNDTILKKFNTQNVWDIYRKEILSLFPLLYDGSTIYQPINNEEDPCVVSGHFKITQLKTQNNILKGCHSLNNNNLENKDYPTIWVEPRNQYGNKIKTPIEILRLKQDIKNSCEKYYSAKQSLENDKNALKKYEKDYKKYLKELKKKEKEDKEREKKEKEDRDKEEKEKIYEDDQEQGLKTREEIADSDNGEKNIDQSEKAISKDIDNKEDINNKLYNKEDLINLNNELNNLKREAKRKEEILKNISKNIKFLKSRRHGEDSEQRQIQQRDYEFKQKELILFQKLIEQREEKLKVISLLINKITEKDENQLSSLLKKNEIEKQKNYLALENELNNITGNHIDDLDQYKNNVQNDEISELKNKLNNLETDEINTQRNLVQSGGRRNKNDLSNLLYKTVTKKKRTKKKNNIRKKEKSLRKRN